MMTMMNGKIKIMTIVVSIYGIIGWFFLTLMVWTALLFGGQEGYVLLAFNLFGEMFFEIFLITGIFILMIISSYKILKEV